MMLDALKSRSSYFVPGTAEYRKKQLDDIDAANMKEAQDLSLRQRELKIGMDQKAINNPFPPGTMMINPTLADQASSPTTEYWNNNSKIQRLAGRSGSGNASMEAPAGDHLLGSGNTIGTSTGGGQAAQAMKSLQQNVSPGSYGAVSGGGGRGGSEVTGSPSGNYSRGPAVSDHDLRMQNLQERSAEHGLTEAERSPEQQAAEAAVLAKSAGETNIGLNTEAEVAGAKNYFQPDVYRANEAKAGAATQQLYERYGRPAETRAAADVTGRGVTANAQIGVADIRAQNASYVAKINALQRTASTMALDDPQRKNIDAVMKYLQDEINKSQVDAPQVPAGLGVR